MKTLMALILGIALLACESNYYLNGGDMFDDDSEMVAGLPREPGISNSKSGGWSTSGIMVQDASPNQLSLQVVFPSAGNYTAQFRIAPHSSTVLQGTRVLAEITWVVEGNWVTRKVHIADGTSITGTGQGCKIVLSDDSLELPVVGTTVTYLAQIQIAKGTRATTENPPIREPAAAFTGALTIAAAGTSDVPVPTESGLTSVCVLVASTPGLPLLDQSVQVQQISSTGTTFKIYDPRQMAWVPLSVGADTIRIVNNSGVEIRATVIFGVDG
jgi:hypothetical protein